MFFLSFSLSFFLRYITSLEVLHETSLPSRENYYNLLTKSHISESDYQQACHVYRTLGFSSLFSQAQFYQRIDIYLLIDVVNAFRILVMKEFQVEALAFTTLPSMAFQVYMCMCKCAYYMNV